LAGQVQLKIAYLLMRWILGLAVLVFRGDQAKNAELLVLRHENMVLRRHAGRVRYEPADRAWFTALTRFIPRRRWEGIFPVTPATLLAWHHKLAASKLRHEHATRARPAGDGPEHRPSCRPPGEGEPAVGIPADSPQADQARRHGRAVDHL
jgi:hypothetical protein